MTRHGILVLKIKLKSSAGAVYTLGAEPSLQYGPFVTGCCESPGLLFA